MQLDGRLIQFLLGRGARKDEDNYHKKNTYLFRNYSALNQKKVIKVVEST